MGQATLLAEPPALPARVSGAPTVEVGCRIAELRSSSSQGPRAREFLKGAPVGLSASSG